MSIHAMKKEHDLTQCNINIVEMKMQVVWLINLNKSGDDLISCRIMQTFLRIINDCLLLWCNESLICCWVCGRRVWNGAKKAVLVMIFLRFVFIIFALFFIFTHLLHLHHHLWIRLCMQHNYVRHCMHFTCIKYLYLWCM